MKDGFINRKEHISCQNTWRGEKYNRKDPRIIKEQKNKGLLTDYFMTKKKRKKQEWKFLTKSEMILCSAISAA